MCRSNPHQGIPSTTVTDSHVTQGRVEYKSTVPRGTDEELDLWEASRRCDKSAWQEFPDFIILQIVMNPISPC